MVKQLLDNDPEMSRRLASQRTSACSVQSKRTWEIELESTRVYGRSSAASSGPSSIFSSKNTTSTQTSYSGLSLADTKVDDMILPIYADDIHHSHLYNFGGRGTKESASDSFHEDSDENSEDTEHTSEESTSPNEQKTIHYTSREDAKNTHSNSEQNPYKTTENSSKYIPTPRRFRH